jgi:rhodanese-related sulfurtransferase
MKLLKLLKALFTPAPRLTPAEAGPRIRSGQAVLIDVREPGEWAGGVAQGSTLLPLSDLNGPRTQWRPFLEANAGRELFVYCAAGGRSGIAAKVLVSEGRRAANTGGFSDWVASGWPVAKPGHKR